MDVFLYLPENEAGVVLDCGLRLVRYGTRWTGDDGARKVFVPALLHPADNPEAYRDKTQACLTIRLPEDQLQVAEGALCPLVLAELPDAAEAYRGTFLPYNKYAFGMYRRPEVLIGSTLLPEQLGRLAHRRDIPNLAGDPEALFLSQQIGNLRTGDPEADEALLFAWFSALANAGKIDTMEDTGAGLVWFRDRNSGRHAVLKKPDSRWLIWPGDLADTETTDG